jgi:hypothetical protein
MANDVLSDEQIANLIDAYGSPHEWADKEVAVALRELQHRRAQENSSLPGTLAAVQAQPVSHAPLHKMSCLSMKGSRLNGDPFPCDCPASEAQPVSARPDVEALTKLLAACKEELECPGQDSVDDFRFGHYCTACDSSVDRNMDLRKAIEAALASVSPLRDETREPDTAGRVEALRDIAAEADRQLSDALENDQGRQSRGIYSSRLALPIILAALQRARESAQGKTR